MKDKLNRRFTSLAALALFVRLVFVPHPGFLADIAYWKWWTKDSAQHGLVHTVTQTGINYPPLYLVVMKATGHVYSLFGNLNDDKTYWDKSNLLFLFLIKIPYIAADLAIGYLIYDSLRKQFKFKTIVLPFSNLNLDLSLVASALWLFNPGVIYNSAVWGQTDSLGVVPILLAYLLAISGRPIFAGALTGVALFLKAQSIPLTLFLYLYLYLRYGLPTAVKSVAAAVFAGLAVTLPFFLTHTMDRIVATILNSVGYFPWASLYAFNLWWLVIRGVSFQFPDQTILAGLWTYRTVGFTLFWTAFAILAFVLWRTKRGNGLIYKDELANRFILSTPLLILSMFLLPTEIHERYLLPFFAFAPLAIPPLYNLYNRYKGHLLSPRFLITVYCLLSVIWLLNLHFVMVKNYPENEQPILNLISPYLPTLGLWFSAINLILYILLFGWFLGQTVVRRALFIPLVLLVPLILLLAQASPMLAAESRSTVLLTSLKPIFATQSWGSLNVNKSVMSNNLSTWYFFSWNGLGTHANSQIDYDLGGAYRRLETNVGVDTDGGEAASVEFLIVGDGRILTRSGVMKKWQFQKHLVADLGGVRKLSLVVTDAGDGINGDHADWLYPTLYK